MTKYDALTEAVIRRIGGPRSEALQTLGDVANHGADSGFSGFTYYKDTHSFYGRNRKLILNAIQEDADSFGTSIDEMMKGWRSLSGVSNPLLALSYCNDDTTTVENALAWYALERAASTVEN